ncbi:MAG TPA: arsenate reductase ArsC [Deltaproteobacteria bacterium]|nr:arsenate reductase ArsC [Deltaproteobacteria bacterium]HPR04819.1 arsenate reductase ArsC [Deltaproteobacteria bacterium]
MERPRVLFLCTGNSARSQMAEAFLRKYAAHAFDVYSAGLEPKGIHPLTVKVMAEAGIDISNHRSKSVGEYMGGMLFGWLITVCGHADANCPAVFPGVGTRMHWEFDDPAAFEGTEEERLREFRRVRDQIRDRVVAWLKEQGIEPV